MNSNLPNFLPNAGRDLQPRPKRLVNPGSLIGRTDSPDGRTSSLDGRTSSLNGRTSALNGRTSSLNGRTSSSQESKRSDSSDFI